ncbi:MAG: glutaminyl-peptide cyclotransferase [Deltaproteobacteria bacterium]|nr:glutaminyl-peptide cyclotransferase [Deltaproteobacteria bacterium]MBI3293455.1 glutaminyl-peptide cyclotransferase [Deltaproteobacteria bacterium]
MVHVLLIFLSALFAAEPAPEKLKLLRKIPHSGYSEGIDFHDGFLWHALPDAILKIDPKDGTVVERFKPATEYSESLAWFQGKLFELSFSDNSISIGTFVKKQLTFKRGGDTSEVHGWGIAHDGKSLIITGNYSPILYFLNPKTLKVERTITAPVTALEDLAWDGEGIWSSSYTERRGQVFRINPKDGSVKKYFLLSEPEECPVIDGTAWDGKALWVTGKHCPSIYQFKNPYLK